MQPEQRYLVVVNPIAGRGDIGYLEDWLEESAPIYTEVYFTNGRNDRQNLSSFIEEANYLTVFAAGGDGTVHLLASLLFGSQTRLAILPLGSGNGLAKDLGLPQDLEGALEVALHGQPRPLDCVLVNGSTCFHIADVGLNAEVVSRFQHGDFRTTKAYAWHLLRTMVSFEPFHAKIFVPEGQVFSDAIMMVAVCNGGRFGSDVIINPTGNLSDGQVELIVVKTFPLHHGPELLLELMAGDVSSPYLHKISCKQARVVLDQPAYFQIDGESREKIVEMTVEVVPGSVSILTPYADM